jgi:hypothetical protein
MNQTLWGVLIGGLIGIAGSLIALVGNILSSKAETRRHLHRLGFELGIKEWEYHLGRIKELKARGARVEAKICPPLHYAYFNFRVLQEQEEGTLKADSYKRICAERNALEQAMQEDSSME